MEMTRRFLVRGAVQGVGFRYFTQRAARDSGVRGFVRNLADGRVEVVAQGRLAALARLELAIRNGPPLARVDGVEVVPGRDPAGCHGFEIHE